MAWRIAIDVGGTFTDAVALDEETGDEQVVKVPSTPENPSTGFIAAVDTVLAKLGLASRSVGMLLHGTTVATNAILEGKYSQMALVVTRGYREMLECARQTVPGDFGNIITWIKPPRIVPLELVREVEGRLDYRGRELRPLDEEGIREIAREFHELNVKAIAVSLLHSYRNPTHEHRVRELILEEHPDCFVSVSSDVIREYREYERTVSTCLNTGLMPAVSSYVGQLQTRMGNRGVEAALYIMKSSGGVTRASELIERPIGAVLSGPAAGVIAANAIARQAGFKDVLTLDMGGTSADIALIEEGIPRILSEGKIDIYDIKSPMIDMTAVGAGGGSIAWLSDSKSLRVGPESAGASPGPVCYGAGGTEPTVTDANLVLGRISPYLLGGTIRLDRLAAIEAVRARVADPLGISVEEAADGILTIAVHNMAAGVRLVSVQRGRDPRRYCLFAFGGAGPLHACLVADALGIRTVVLPLSPGATSAEGLLYSDVRVDHVITDVQREDELDVERLADEYRNLRRRVEGELAAQGFEGEQVRLEGFLDIRYAGHAYELRIPLGATNGAPALVDIQQAETDFHAAHDDRYGYSHPEDELVEIVNIGLTGFGLLPRPSLLRRTPASTDWESARKETRRMYVRSLRAVGDCNVYDRTLAPVGVKLVGPAIVEQYDSTLVVEDGWVVASNEFGHLILSRH